ncbi:MAG: phosphatidylglycerophosphatase A [Holosporales bacterium]|jgi:phosphatidylglycerophosphatase A|nr:phosphatidylglycerophosphatase A [Holosporales bacterium]
MEQKYRKTGIDWMIATCGGIGYLPKCPGTWGALLALGLWSIGPTCYSPSLLFTFLCVAIPLSGITILLVLRCTTEKDPSYIVVDEFLGQLLALACIPQIRIAGFLAFLLFRLFDIKKQGPIRSLDAISKRASTSPEIAAICILGDDLLAGLCAGILVRITWWLAA